MQFITRRIACKLQHLTCRPVLDAKSTYWQIALVKLGALTERIVVRVAALLAEHFPALTISKATVQHIEKPIAEKHRCC
jgi:hypothetical protein